MHLRIFSFAAVLSNSSQHRASRNALDDPSPTSIDLLPQRSPAADPHEETLIGFVTARIVNQKECEPAVRYGVSIKV
jgi:hypothetical protein